MGWMRGRSAGRRAVTHAPMCVCVCVCVFVCVHGGTVHVQEGHMCGKDTEGHGMMRNSPASKARASRLNRSTSQLARITSSARGEKWGTL